MAHVKNVLLLLPASTPDADEPNVKAVLDYAHHAGVSLVQVESQAFYRSPADYLQEPVHVLAWAHDEQLHGLAELASKHGFSLGWLPLPGHSLVHRWFDIPRKLDEALMLALEEAPLAIDLLRCNGEVVLGMVNVGETPFLTQIRRQQSFFANLLAWFVLLWQSLHRLLDIRVFPVTLRYGDEKSCKTALVGMVVPENDVKGAAFRLLNTHLSARDGLLSCVLLAPKSVREYLHFLLAGFWRSTGAFSQLPKAVAFLRSTKISLESDTPIVYFVDGKKREASAIELSVEPAVLQLCAPTSYREWLMAAQTAKESVHLDNLPQKEQRIKLIAQRLPYFTRALEDEFRELFLQIRDNARVTGNFLMLMVLSSIIATMGLVQSSPAVIIGAMVLAPLMAPIISFAMGLLRADMSLVKQSLVTIITGIALAMGTAALISQSIPFAQMTPEIAARLQPNLLDMVIALVSGIAGAFAYVRENIARSASGVAIAVALVPPLCVVGIGVGWLDFAVVQGAFLLFLTNLVGISLAASVTFLLLGYAPLVRAKRGIVAALMMLIIVSIPLSHSFETMLEMRRATELGENERFRVNGKDVVLDVQDVRLDSADGIYLIIRGAVASDRNLTSDDLKFMQNQLQIRLGRRVELELIPLLRVPYTKDQAS